ncbi:MAG: hypothetical protein CL484_14420 [Acidobacteria bacterium]|nr:hypothetical protein [Acidobacteriota bacterium]
MTEPRQILISLPSAMRSTVGVWTLPRGLLVEKQSIVTAGNMPENSYAMDYRIAIHVTSVR